MADSSPTFSWPPLGSYGHYPSVKLVAIAKDEGPYLAQWIFHHLDLGINEIEIWLNNSTDNSSKILSRISRHDDRVTFVEADAFYKACQTSKYRFQDCVYAVAFDTARPTGKHTHILFLDLDEYLLRRDMRQSISDLIRNSGNFDVMSFLWYLDEPSSANPFSDVLCESQKIYRNHHIKSMASLASKAITKPLWHNFLVKNNCKILNILPGGIELDKSNTTRNKQCVNLDKVSLPVDEPEDWFVYHKIYKSRLEYCVSLLRGRGHVSKKLPLKDNRSGYLKPVDTKGIVLDFSSDVIVQYKARQKSYLENAGIPDLILDAERLYLTKYQLFTKLLDDNPGLRREFSRQLRGTGHESDPPASTQDSTENAPTTQAFRMPSKPLKQSARIKELFFINQLKLFYQESAYVACFGEPATASDGWIINLPASHCFEGDYNKLPFETLLDATWVHEQVVVRDPLSRYITQNRTSIPIPGQQKAARIGGLKYEPADLFRDIATIFNDLSQFHLAFDFITKAHELRPKGPVIARMLAELNLKCQRNQ